MSSLKVGSCAKLAPKLCGPFHILEKVGPVAYRLALPPTVKAHDVFHISLLKNYVCEINHIIDWSVIQVESKGEFQLEPLKENHALESSNRVGLSAKEALCTR